MKMRNNSRVILLFSVGIALVRSGCVPEAKLRPSAWLSSASDAPTGRVSRVLGIWSEAVVREADSPIVQGFVCKVYLYGPNSHEPITAPGKFQFFAFEENAPDTIKHKAEADRQWIFTEDDAKVGLHRDTIGWGYRFFLSWGPPGRLDRSCSLACRFSSNADSNPVLSEFAIVTMPGMVTSEVQGNVYHRTISPEELVGIKPKSGTPSAK